MGTIFVAGIYGVGKSTLCDSLAEVLDIPSYSAGDLISQVNGEIYGANKALQNKYSNQDILALAVDEKLKYSSTILLAGHFCIFDKHNHVDRLPCDIFQKLHIQQILVLISVPCAINNGIPMRCTLAVEINSSTLKLSSIASAYLSPKIPMLFFKKRLLSISTNSSFICLS